MTRRRLRAPSLAAAAAIAAIATASAQEPAAPTESLARVRAALARPPSKLTLKDRPPDFTVHIETRPPMADIFDVPAWSTDPVGWQPPSLGFDLLSLFRSVVKSTAEAKRGHDLRLAREEVQRSVADYCAALPASDSRAATAEPSASGDWRASAAQICSTSPAIR